MEGGRRTATELRGQVRSQTESGNEGKVARALRARGELIGGSSVWVRKATDPAAQRAAAT